MRTYAYKLYAIITVQQQIPSFTLFHCALTRSILLAYNIYRSVHFRKKLLNALYNHFIFILPCLRPRACVRCICMHVNRNQVKHNKKADCILSDVRVGQGNDTHTHNSCLLHSANNFFI